MAAAELALAAVTMLAAVTVTAAVAAAAAAAAVVVAAFHLCLLILPGLALGPPALVSHQA